MGTNAISTATEGSIIPSDHHNQIKSALSIDLVPRNTSGVATNQAGSLGTSTFGWLNAYVLNAYVLNAYVKKLFVGTTANNNIIEENGLGDISIKRNDAIVCTIDSGGLTGIKNDSVITAKILNNNVTRAKLALVGQQTSALSGSFAYSGSSFVDVTNLSVTLTTTGRPVMIVLVPSNTGGSLGLSNAFETLTAVDVSYRIMRDAVSIAEWNIVGLANSVFSPLYPGNLSCLDVVGSGTYVYKFQTRVAGGWVRVTNCKLLAYEL